MSKKFHFISVIIIVISNQLLAQNQNYEIIYEVNFQKFSSTSKIFSTYARLQAVNDKSIYAWNDMFLLDSISNARKLSDAELIGRRVFEPHVIRTIGNLVKYNEVVGNVNFGYQEDLNLQWKFYDDSKIIQNLNCKKATLNYGGRDWVAWYSTDIPMSHGPYKFKGLPGLIVHIYDTGKVFDFNLVQIAVLSDELQNIDPSLGLKHENQVLTRLGFNELKEKFYAMTSTERLNFMNKDKSIRYSALSRDPITGQVNRELVPPPRIFLEIRD